MRRPLAALLALALPLAACTRHSDPERPAAPAERTGLTVLAAGSTPRRVLRVGLVEGATTTLAVTVSLGLTQDGGATSIPVRTPTVTEEVRFRVDDTGPDGATVSFEIADARLDRSGTDLTDLEFVRLTAAVQQVVGVRGTAVVPPSGSATRLRLHAPAGAAPEVLATLDQLEQQLGRLVPPLPRVAVGRGARWRVTETLRSGGVVVDRTTTYRVVALTGSRVDYEAEVRQEARPDRGAGPSTSAGPAAELVTATVSGTTTGHFSLGDLASSSTTSLRGTQQVRTTDGDASSTATQRLTLRVTVAPSG